MNGSIIAFTAAGAELCARLCRELEGDWTGFAPRRHLVPGLEALDTGVEQWAAARFQGGGALIFVGAAGIAVRAVAPHLRGKDKDPAVVCVDEAGRHAVPLLSGHIGGANGLARAVAALTGGEAVLTTATDVRGVFAADEWAVGCGCRIPDTAAVKQLSAALLEGEAVGFFSRFPTEGRLPPGLTPAESGGVGLCVSHRREAPFAHTLLVAPPCLWVGVGCRRGVEPAMLERHVLELLDGCGLLIEAVAGIATIDLKAEEPAVLRLCRRYGLPLRTFSAEALRGAPGEFSGSAFVESVTGVDNVCQRAAALAGGEVIVPKRAGKGVTAAVAKLDWRVRFADTDGGN